MALTREQRRKVEQYIEVFDPAMLDNDNLAFVLTDSSETLSEACFGTQYEKAVALLTLHTLTIAAQTAGGSAAEGFVVQRTIGPITIKWANPSSGNRWDKYLAMYRTTKYGLQLIDLINSCTAGAGFSVNHAWRELQ